MSFDQLGTSLSKILRIVYFLDNKAAPCIIVLQQSKEEGKDQESLQSNTTSDPGHHMGK